MGRANVKSNKVMTGEELGQKLLQSVREMKAGKAAGPHRLHPELRSGSVILTSVIPDKQIRLKSLGCALPAKHSHNLDNFAAHAVVNAIHATDTAPISIADVVNSRVFVRCFGDVAEALNQRFIVSIGLKLAKFFHSAPVDAYQIHFRLIAELVPHHAPVHF